MELRERFYRNYQTLNLAGETALTAQSLQGLSDYYRRSIIDKFLPPDKGLSILDLGCGCGPFLYACQQAGYRNLAGVDASPEQVALARELGLNQVIQGDLRNFLATSQERYNVITAFDVLEHFTKAEVMEILDQVYTALHPGGLFLLRTPNGEGPFAGRYFYGDFTHEVCFTRHSLAQVLRAAGFAEMSFYEVAPLPHGVKSTIRFLLWHVIKGCLWFYQAVETGGWRDRHIFTQNIMAVNKK
ncbi:class I SAM-dependent DNA methyltransferase [Desulfobacca acetoxidans]|uniref:Methyltransferase type 12 n=1 Tax=Desulfobacca acetoxidans (strain ATCC 700848 / DSM 11109 / ASRB2) TaxID=880072 RepID=F2NJJ4_DESAR|nr:class I SAM-dependent methyltransferase [Desulfobacca acetoxidans]AEB09506.1 Methyltransferase type 12 [Desulfobacca acetoxidans DSM 11109]